METNKLKNDPHLLVVNVEFSMNVHINRSFSRTINVFKRRSLASSCHAVIAYKYDSMGEGYLYADRFVLTSIPTFVGLVYNLSAACLRGGGDYGVQSLPH